MLTDTSYKILYPHGGTRLVTKNRSMRYANKGELFMRCGGCGDTDFTLIVKPAKLGAAKLIMASCSRCNKSFPFNDKGETGGTLKAEEADLRKRERINDRPDT